MKVLYPTTQGSSTSGVWLIAGLYLVDYSGSTFLAFLCLPRLGLRRADRVPQGGEVGTTRILFVAVVPRYITKVIVARLSRTASAS
jgi:hypothetical protein